MAEIWPFRINFNLTIPSDFHCFLFLCDNYVVVDSLFIVIPILCGCYVFDPSFVMQYLRHFLVLQSSS